MSLREQLRSMCDGSPECQGLEHWHGCHADTDGSSCDMAKEHLPAELRGCLHHWAYDGNRNGSVCALCGAFDQDDLC